MKITYNAPFTLTFSFICIIIFGINALFPQLNIIQKYFTSPPSFDILSKNSMYWINVFSSILGHANLSHLSSNLSMLLLLAPLLEEKYNSIVLLFMTLITAFMISMLQMILFPMTTSLGASGIVFMMIILSSFTNIKHGQIPLTFLAIFLLYLGKEIVSALKPDNISQFAHIFGGIIGSIFGFLMPIKKSGDEKTI